MFRPISTQLISSPELQIAICEHADAIPTRILKEIEKGSAANGLVDIPLHLLITFNVINLSEDHKSQLRLQVLNILNETLTNSSSDREKQDNDEEMKLPIVLIAKYTLVTLINNLRIGLEHIFKISFNIDEKLKKKCQEAEEYQARFARSPSMLKLSESSRSESPTFLSSSITPKSPRPGSRARTSSLASSSLRKSESLVSLQDLESPKFQGPKLSSP